MGRIDVGKGNRSSGENYRGFRQRKWRKWVSEIREPGKKSRTWLGSLETREMPAAGHDVAALYLRGRSARLNFPEVAGQLPRTSRSNPNDILLAALQAALSFAPTSSTPAEAAASSPVSDAPLDHFSNDMFVDSPRLWWDLTKAMLRSPPRVWSTTCRTKPTVGKGSSEICVNDAALLR